MATPNLVQHFAMAILAGARRQGIDETLLTGTSTNAHQHPCEEQDLLRFLQVLRNLVKDEFYGLASARCPPGVSDLGIELMALSENLGDALKKCCRFYAMVTDGLRFRLSEQKDVASIEIAAIDAAFDEHHFLIEWQVIRWYKLAQWLIGEKIPLLRVEFMHAAEIDRSEYAQVFGENCVFNGAHNRICFARKYLKRKVIRRLADFEATKFKSQGLLSSADVYRTWRTLLKSSLRARLARKMPMPTMEELAFEFGVSSQTLRRKLKAENSSYRQLKAEAQCKEWCEE